jgi:hypothetical protein
MKNSILRKESTSPVTQGNSWSSPVSNGQGACFALLDYGRSTNHIPSPISQGHLSLSFLTVPHLSFFFILPFTHTHPPFAIPCGRQEVEKLNTQPRRHLRAPFSHVSQLPKTWRLFLFFFSPHEQDACLFRISFSSPCSRPREFAFVIFQIGKGAA